MQLDRTIYNADNLLVMSRMPGECVDLIYLDPPFNSGKQWENPLKETGKKVSFKDTWTLADIHEDDHEILQGRCPAAAAVIETLGYANGGSWQAYLTYMGMRLVQMHRLLKPTGSIYYHCDPTMSHGVKLMMDCIFGKKNFRNEIVWAYTGPGSPKMRQFNRKHDIVFWYSKGDEWTFNQDDVRVPYKDGKPHTGGFKSSMDNSLADNYGKKGKIPETWWSDIALAIRGKENTGYPTQKPIALLRRILKASSNPGDLVLDPFCGCGVTAAASELFFDDRRRWIGIDVGTEAKAALLDKLNRKGYHLFAGSLPSIDMVVGSDLPDLPPIPKRKEVMEILHKGQGGKCRCCEKSLTGQHPEIDHLRPRAKGGDNHLSNLHLLCRECHKKKGTKTMTDTRRRVIAENAAASMEKWRKESAAALVKEKAKAIAKAEKQKRMI
ncbi:MAG: DNA methyltransferase [Gammaproteobacteria bacterium]